MTRNELLEVLAEQAVSEEQDRIVDAVTELRDSGKVDLERLEELYEEAYQLLRAYPDGEFVERLSRIFR